MTSKQAEPCRRWIRDDAGPDAPWLLLVHGVSQDHRLFDRQVAQFAKDYRLLLVDLPGHGLSSDLPGPYDPHSFAENLRVTLDLAAIETCLGWGTHLGATALLLLALARPGRLRALVLEAPVVPGRPLPSVSSLLERVRAAAQIDGLGAARLLWWREGAWFDAIRAEPIARRAEAQWAMIETFQGGPWTSPTLVPSAVKLDSTALAGLACPSLIINGELDPTDFLESAALLADTLPNARRAEIADCGGFPLWEKPKETNTLVQDFLLSLTAPG